MRIISGARVVIHTRVNTANKGMRHLSTLCRDVLELFSLWLKLSVICSTHCTFAISLALSQHLCVRYVSTSFIIGALKHHCLQSGVKLRASAICILVSKSSNRWAFLSALLYGRLGTHMRRKIEERRGIECRGMGFRVLQNTVHQKFAKFLWINFYDAKSSIVTALSR